MPSKRKWSPYNGKSWWCIVRRDFDRDWFFPWCMAATREGAWEAWRKWLGDEQATPAMRRKYVAVKVIVTEVPNV